MITAEDLNAAVEHAVKNLRRAVRNLRKFHGANPASFPKVLIDHPIVHLKDDLVADARVFATRHSLLRGMPLPRGGVCCEIGTSTGAFAREIIEVLAPSKMHIIDIDFSRFDPAIRDMPGVITCEGDSRRILGDMPDHSLDFAYVDADHSYAAVRSEIELLLRKVKPGGYVMFNDYTRWSLTQVVPYGVLSAVNELIVHHNAPMAAVALSGTGHFDVLVRLGQ